LSVYILVLDTIFKGSILGHVEVDVIIGDLEGKKRIKVTALVDTEATFTVIPESISKDLNLNPIGEKVKVSTAKGYDELDLTHAVLEIGEKRRIMPILISRQIDRVLIGVTTLEAMQLRVNPLTKKLEEYTVLLY
jgi:clan AA aspartic protease